MFNLWLDYPSFNEELEIVKSTTSMYLPELKNIIDTNELIVYQDLIRKVPVADNVIEFAVRTVNNTRPANESSPKFVKELVRWGAGPRASQYLILAAKTKAVLEGRFTPNIDDVKAALIPVLRHRIINNFNAEAEGITTVEIINRLINGN
jgi:MoxR-like ATPase